MLGRLVWIALFAGALWAGYHWTFVASRANPGASPRGAMNAFADALLTDNVPAMRLLCRAEATRQIDELRAELATRRQRGSPVIQISVTGNTGGANGRAQGLLMVTDRTGNTLPLWDIYATQDPAGRWWIDRFTPR